jgi:hypothetical protein
MQEPMITIYQPQRSGDRWVARADIVAKGEKIELAATASHGLARRAGDWYNRGAHFLSKWVQYRGEAAPGMGVFGDLAEVAYNVASSQQAIPYDEDIEAAAAVFAGCCGGEPEALEQAGRIAELAPKDELAACAWEKLQLIDRVIHTRDQLPLAHIFAGAHRGDPDAQEVIAALRATRPRVAASSPVRLGWHVEDYLSDRERLSPDLEEAANDEFGARIVRPHGRTVRRVRPSLAAPMLRTYQQLLSAYAW